MNAMAKRKIVIAGMLVLLIVSVALSGGVLAKYVSTSNAKPSTARVARWGFIISANADDLLGSAYDGDRIDIDVGAGSLDVNAEEELDVLAPDASGSMSFSISGTSEVLAKLTVQIGGSEIFLQKGEEFYYPIVWTLKKGGEVLVSGRLADVNAYFADDPATDANELEVEPNTHSAFEGDYVLSWTWEFTNADSGITDLSVNHADTLLGFAAVPTEKRTAEQTEALAEYTAGTTLSLSMSIVIEQIQK